MHFSKSIFISIFVLLIFSTFVAVFGIRVFNRLTPYVEQINIKNTHSLMLCEKMLSNLVDNNQKEFVENLEKQKNNITEQGEEELINELQTVYKSAFSGDINARKRVITLITNISSLNRSSMANIIDDIEYLSSLSVWIMFFLLCMTWAIGFFVLNSLKKSIVAPLNELESVLDGVAEGNRMRRCPSIAKTADFQKIYDGVNNLLDINFNKL